jgi:hypothetical protein
MNVTDAIKIWLSGSNGNTIPNYGFLLQFADADELMIPYLDLLDSFSRETHTIYVPKLTMYFDNSTFTTGSLTSGKLRVIYSLYTN